MGIMRDGSVRRTAGGRAALGIASLWLVALGVNAASEAADRTVTVATWGGPYEHSQEKAYFEPFTQETGIRVETARYGGGLDELRRQVDSGEITWDLLDMTMADNRAACRQGLLEPMDHSVLLPALDGTPAGEDFVDGALTECGVSHIVYAMVVAYNRDAFPGERPARMKDLFDTRRFPGKRALQKLPEANLEWALRSYGVPREDLYQLLSTERGLRLAFERLDGIREQVIWWTAIEQPVELLVSGEAVIASQFNGRLFDAAVIHGHPIEIVWDAQIYELGSWGIPRGTAHLDEVVEFIRFATGTRPLADQAKYISYGPARRSSMQLVSTRSPGGCAVIPGRRAVSKCCLSGSCFLSASHCCSSTSGEWSTPSWQSPLQHVKRREHTANQTTRAAPASPQTLVPPRRSPRTAGAATVRPSTCRLCRIFGVAHG